MTEAEWMACEEPARMLGAVRRWDTAYAEGSVIERLVASSRKLRLFACACCRSVWHLLTDPRSRRAVEVAERFADGEATEEEYVVSHGDTDGTPASSGDFASWFTWSVLRPGHTPLDNANRACDISAGGLSDAVKAALLRDVVGNPWRPVVVGVADGQVRDDRVCEKCGTRFPAHPGRCTTCGSEFIRKWRWRDDRPWAFTPAVLSLARAAYARDWGAMVPLSDALEEAGCTDEALLRHLRGYRPCGCNLLCPDWCTGWRKLDGPHVRGCWALDLMLGKN